MNEPVFRVSQCGCGCQTPKAAAEPTQADRLRRGIGGPGISEAQIQQNQRDLDDAARRRATHVPSPNAKTPTRQEYIDKQINKENR